MIINIVSKWRISRIKITGRNEAGHVGHTYTAYYYNAYNGIPKPNTKTEISKTKMCFIYMFCVACEVSRCVYTIYILYTMWYVYVHVKHTCIHITSRKRIYILHIIIFYWCGPETAIDACTSFDCGPACGHMMYTACVP